MLSTGFTAEYCMDAFTPRAAGFLLDVHSRREARQLLQLVSIIHGDPKEVQSGLKDVAFPPPPQKPMGFTDSLAQMAEALGQHQVAKKIRTRDLALKALARIKGEARA